MGTLVLAGATSGSATLTPVDAVTAVITLPSATATLATLGANTFVGNQAITGTLSASGNFLVGTTSVISSSKTSVAFTGSTLNGAAFNDTDGANGTGFIFFETSGTIIGNIGRVGSTSAVAYTTTSDRRLKSEITPIKNSGIFIDSLLPRNFIWTESKTKDQGFIADEFQKIIPLSVIGEPDAIDAEGKPIYQSIDTSSGAIVANIVSELQSLRARLAALEAK
jgi:hypothetical protein